MTMLNNPFEQSSRVRAPESGFTLIELIISIGILGGIMVTGYGALNQITRSKQILDEQREGSILAGAVVNRIARELQLAYGEAPLMPPPNAPNERYNRRKSLIGESVALANGGFGDRISFLALQGGQYVPDGATHTGLVQITYRVEKAPPEEKLDTFYLVRDEVPYERPFEKAFKKIMTFPLSSQLVSFRVRYYFADDDEWLSQWGDDAHLKLPSLISFAVVLRTPSGREESYSTSVALPESPE